MIEKVVQQICAIDYFVGKYTLVLINQFVQRQNFLIDEDISGMGLLSSSKCSSKHFKFYINITARGVTDVTIRVSVDCRSNFFRK